MAIKNFRENVYRHFSNRIVKEVLKLIKKERQGINISGKLVANCTMMLEDMDCYIEEFQRPLLEKTRVYFENLAKKWISEYDVPEYLEKIYDITKEELKRADIYLKQSTAPLLKDILRDTMVDEQMNFILDSENLGFISLLKDNRLEHLKKMYLLMQESKELVGSLATRLEKYIFETGKAFVTSPQNLLDPISFVQSLLNDKSKFDSLVSYSFSNDKQIKEALENGFTKIADGNLQKRIAEYLSLYLDYAMRNFSQSQEFEKSLDNALQLFSYLQDKDVFENYYKIHLSKRLLFSRSFSVSTINENELLVIMKLKEKCGYSFVSKLEGMLNDMRLSKKIHEKFLNHDEYKDVVKPLNIDLFVNVLTSCFWPSYTVCNARLPKPMLSCTNAFRNYYKDTHKHRVLTWKKNLGDGIMIARFPLSKHELIVTTYQMIILMVFNELNEITFEDLAKETEIPEKDLERNLMILFLGKHKLISKEPKTKAIKSTDVLKWNASFKSKEITIKVSGKQVKDSKDSKDAKDEDEDKEEYEEEQQEEGKLTTSIINYLSSKKEVVYKDVFSHISKTIGDSSVNALDFKKEVERLIQIGRVQRNEEDRRILKFVK